MNYFLKKQLEIIAQETENQEKTAQRIKRAIRDILMFEVGATYYDYVHSEKYKPDSNSTLQLNQESNGYQEIVSQTIKAKSVEEIIREVKEMIIELQIKGSVREHRNGLLKFHNTVFGSIYGRTKEEIEKQLKEKIKQFKNKPQKDKTESKKTAPLLSEFYRAEYLPFKRSDGIAERTIDNYESYMRFIVSQKFDKSLQLYKPKDIQGFLYSFPQTRKRQIIQGFLNNMFNRAITAGYIKNNPCNAVEKVKHKQERGTAFSFEEQIEFFKLLINNQHLSYRDKCYFIAVYLTGARRNELRDLVVEDVDFKNKVLHIKGTKTGGSDRNVPLTPLVEKLLLSMGITKGRYFSITENTADFYFREVWEKKKGHKLHDLRHTFGTIQICVNKIDVKTVSLWLGHSTTSTTLNIYTHPEQLDKGTFLNGGLSEAEKNEIYKQKYNKVLGLIERFLV